MNILKKIGVALAGASLAISGALATAPAANAANSYTHVFTITASPSDFTAGLDEFNENAGTVTYAATADLDGTNAAATAVVSVTTTSANGGTDETVATIDTVSAPFSVTIIDSDETYKGAKLVTITAVYASGTQGTEQASPITFTQSSATTISEDPVVCSSGDYLLAYTVTPDEGDFAPGLDEFNENGGTVTYTATLELDGVEANDVETVSATTTSANGGANETVDTVDSISSPFDVLIISNNPSLSLTYADVTITLVYASGARGTEINSPITFTPSASTSVSRGSTLAIACSTPAAGGGGSSASADSKPALDIAKEALASGASTSVITKTSKAAVKEVASNANKAASVTAKLIKTAKTPAAAAAAVKGALSAGKNAKVDAAIAVSALKSAKTPAIKIAISKAIVKAAPAAKNIAKNGKKLAKAETSGKFTIAKTAKKGKTIKASFSKGYSAGNVVAFYAYEGKTKKPAKLGTYVVQGEKIKFTSPSKAGKYSVAAYNLSTGKLVGKKSVTVK